MCVLHAYVCFDRDVAGSWHGGLRCTQAGTQDTRVPVVLQNPEACPRVSQNGKDVDNERESTQCDPVVFCFFFVFLLDFMIAVSKGCRSWGEY